MRSGRPPRKRWSWWGAVPRSFRSPISSWALRPRTIRPKRASSARTQRFDRLSKSFASPYVTGSGKRAEPSPRLTRERMQFSGVRQWRPASASSRKQRPSSREKGISDPSEYNNLLERAAGLEREIEALKKEQHRAEALDKEAVEALTEYREQRSELSKRRRRFATETSSDVIRVVIDPIREPRAPGGRAGRDSRYRALRERPSGDCPEDSTRTGPTLELGEARRCSLPRHANFSQAS